MLLTQAGQATLPVAAASSPAPVAASFTTATFTTSISEPASVVSGNVLVLFWFTTSASTTTVTGFTSQLTQTSVSGSSYGAVLTKVASGAGGPYTVSTNGYGVLYRVTGANATPFDLGGSTAGTGTAVSIGSLTPSVSNTLLLAASFCGAGAPGDFATFTLDANFGTAVKSFSKSHASGATGALTATNPNGTYNSLAVAIKPV